VYAGVRGPADTLCTQESEVPLARTVTVKAVLNNVQARFKLRGQAGHEGLLEDLARHFNLDEGSGAYVKVE
jgi:hypothetical protein